MGNTITRSAELEELIDSTVTIPTLPTTLAEINRICQSPDGSTQEAATLIERDPPIAAKVLRLVNSSLYGLRNPVMQIPLACSILGLRIIKNIVVQATVLENFSDGPELESFDVNWLWDHSFKTAVAARMLVEHSPAAFPITKEDAYTCGLVHDVGKMILLQSQPDHFAEAIAASRENSIPLAKAEGSLFGFSHAHVGGLLAERWGLANELQVAVMYHHSPGGDAEQWALGFLIHAANSFAHRAAEGSGGWTGDVASPDSLAVLDIPDDTLAEILETVATTSIELDD